MKKVPSATAAGSGVMPSRPPPPPSSPLSPTPPKTDSSPNQLNSVMKPPTGNASPGPPLNPPPPTTVYRYSAKLPPYMRALGIPRPPVQPHPSDASLFPPQRKSRSQSIEDVPSTPAEETPSSSKVVKRAPPPRSTTSHQKLPPKASPSTNTPLETSPNTKTVAVRESPISKPGKQLHSPKSKRDPGRPNVAFAAIPPPYSIGSSTTTSVGSKAPSGATLQSSKNDSANQTKPYQPGKIGTAAPGKGNNNPEPTAQETSSSSSSDNSLRETNLATSANKNSVPVHKAHFKPAFEKYSRKQNFPIRSYVKVEGGQHGSVVQKPPVKPSHVFTLSKDYYLKKKIPPKSPAFPAPGYLSPEVGVSKGKQRGPTETSKMSPSVPKSRFPKAALRKSVEMVSPKVSQPTSTSDLNANSNAVSGLCKEEKEKKNAENFVRNKKREEEVRNWLCKRYPQDCSWDTGKLTELVRELASDEHWLRTTQLSLGHWRRQQKCAVCHQPYKQCTCAAGPEAGFFQPPMTAQPLTVPDPMGAHIPPPSQNPFYSPQTTSIEPNRRGPPLKNTYNPYLQEDKYIFPRPLPK